MCCQYVYNGETIKAALYDFELDPEQYFNQDKRIVKPQDKALLITGIENRAEVKEAFWGFPLKDSLVINARSESAITKPMFSDSIMNRRCIIPADSFFEWDNYRNKVSFTVENLPFFFLAGIWRMYPECDRFVVLTTAANASMAPVHDRMPVMIDRADAKTWLFDKQGYKELMTRSMPELTPYVEFEQIRMF